MSHCQGSAKNSFFLFFSFFATMHVDKLGLEISVTDPGPILKNFSAQHFTCGIIFKCLRTFGFEE